MLTQGTSDVVGVPDLDALVAHLGATRPTVPPATDRITTADGLRRVAQRVSTSSSTPTRSPARSRAAVRMLLRTGSR